MSEEKRRILEMLEAGKITQEDAARLLDALGEEGDTDEPQKSLEETVEPHKSPEEPVGTSEEKADWADLLGNLGAGVDKAVQEAIQAASPVLENLGSEVDSAVQQACKALKKSTVVGVVLPQKGSDQLPLPLEENVYEAPVGAAVTKLRVEWINGPLEIRSWEGDTIRVAEYASRPLKDGERMDLREENGTLRIRWSRGKFFRGKIFLQKHLVVELPKDAFLEETRVDTVAGGMYVTGLHGETVRLETVSGPMECCHLQGETLRVESVSGSVALRNVSARELRVSTTSGAVNLEGFGAQKLRAETVSGALTVWGNGEEVNLETISGAVVLQVEQYPKQGKLSTVSGRIDMILPEGEPGFSVEYDSVSGRFSTEFPLTGKLGKREGRAVYGQGGAKFHLDTVSGKMELRKLVSASE